MTTMHGNVNWMKLTHPSLILFFIPYGIPFVHLPLLQNFNSSVESTHLRIIICLPYVYNTSRSLSKFY